jgi:hypothetical protein
VTFAFAEKRMRDMTDQPVSLARAQSSHRSSANARAGVCCCRRRAANLHLVAAAQVYKLTAVICLLD